MKSHSYEFKTPFGSFCLRATLKGLYSLERVLPLRRIHPSESKSRIPPRIRSLLKRAAREVDAYLTGQGVDFCHFPVDWTGVGAFERRVLQELRKIPRGRTESYQFLAQKAGRPKAARFVGRILHLNRLPFIVPCHRIVPKRGGLGGFSRGVRWKKRLLKIERNGADTKGESVS